MRVIQLPDLLYDYLLEVVELHTRRGIHPEEGLAAHQLWGAIKNHAVHIDEEAVQKAVLAASPEGQSPVRQFDPRNPLNSPIECPKCYDEEGSLACIRPAHQGRQTGPIEGT